VTTPFLSGLIPPDLRRRDAKVASEFMRIKGYARIRPLGYLVISESDEDDCWYYYYELPEGVLELEVTNHKKEGRYSRLVTGFINDPKEIRELLGRDPSA
jgi:hypothetical protein